MDSEELQQARQQKAVAVLLCGQEAQEVPQPLVRVQQPELEAEDRLREAWKRVLACWRAGWACSQVYPRAGSTLAWALVSAWEWAAWATPVSGPLGV